MQPGPVTQKALLVCNGFKDFEYISLALFARKLDLNTIIVLEQEEELDLVIELSKKIGVRPVIGARAKLRNQAFWPFRVDFRREREVRVNHHSDFARGEEA
ncbi:hypothetical protein M0R45_008426 [Rubus argutus]|uniref:Arginine decarboxylase n=1 Tax=Rubus argutus TaxID=59490 RepID=A0AAW1Y4E3_RUBAR